MRPRTLRLLLALIAALVVGAVAGYLVPPPLPELTRAEFLDEVRAGHVRSIVIKDQELITGVSSTRGAFRSDFRKADDRGLPAALRALGVEISFETSALGLI